VVLKDGFSAEPGVRGKILLAGGLEVLSDEVLSRVFQAVAAPPDRVAFSMRFSMKAAVANFKASQFLISLASARRRAGARFRYFARPIEFAPRSAIRMQITRFQNSKASCTFLCKDSKRSACPARRLARDRRAG